jgi:hypothetical protein
VNAPTITFTAPGVAPQVGVLYNQSITASGGTAPYTFTLVTGQGTGLPPGLTLHGDGTLTGTPAMAGTFTFAVQATDSSAGSGPFTQTSPLLTLTVLAATTTHTTALTPPTLHTPILLAFFDQFFHAVETLNADGTVTVTANIFGFPLVSTYNSGGSLVSVTLLGFNVTALFE